MTYLESISQFPEYVQERLILGTQRVGFVSDLPEELSFLRGFADLGFENLGLSEEQYTTIASAFDSGGIRVPGTPYRLRHRSVRGIVEPADGSEPMLPDYWRQAVMVYYMDKFTWIGMRVRPSQLIGLDLYHVAGDGYELDRISPVQNRGREEPPGVQTRGAS